MRADVVWIGGGTGGAKTTVARALAARYGLRVFAIDAFWYAHEARLGESRLEPDDQWLHLTPLQQADLFEATARRRFALVLADLAGLPLRPSIVVEGPQVRPEMLWPGAAAVFLIPSEAFQRSNLTRRPLPATADPARALANRIEKDRLYAERLRVAAAGCGFPVIDIDGSMRPGQLVNAVERVAAPVLAVHRPPADLSGVRRWQNDVAADNVARWLASADVPPGPPPTLAFDCECGRPGCNEQVNLTLAQYQSAGRVLAPGHR
jgi:hypothetical protein